MKLPPVTELELSLTLLPSSIGYCTAAVEARKRPGASETIRAQNLIIAIAWLKSAQKQIAVAKAAARTLGLVKDSTWCGACQKAHARPFAVKMGPLPGCVGTKGGAS